MDEETTIQSNLLDEEIFLEHEHLHSPRFNTTAISRAASASPSPMGSPVIAAASNQRKSARAQQKTKLNQAIGGSGDFGDKSYFYNSESNEDAIDNDGSIGDNDNDNDNGNEDLDEDLEDKVPSKANSNVILCALTISALGQTLLMTSNIDVMTTLICDAHFHKAVGSSLSGGLAKVDPMCRTPEVAAIVADFASQRQIIAGLLSIICTPKLSELSDRFGRKPLLVFTSIGIVLAEIISLMCMLFPDKVHYRWLLFVSVIQGSGGSIGTLQLLNSSYVVDVVPSKHRAKFLGRLDSVFFACMALGPPVGSLLLHKFQSLVLLYCISLTCAVIFSLVAIFYLVESRTLKARRMSQALHNENRMLYMREHTRASHAIRHRPSHVKLLHSSKGVVLEHFNVLKPLKLLGFNHIRDPKRKRNARILTAISAMTAELGLAVASVILLYSETRFQWTAVETGYLMALTGVSRSLLLAVAYPLVVAFLVKRIGFNTKNIDRTDVLLLRCGLFAQVTGHLLIFKATTGYAFTMALVYECFGAWMMPTLKSGLVKYAEEGKVGELFGALSLVNSCGSVVVPILFLQIYKYTVATLPGAVFLLASGGIFVVLLSTLFLRPVKNNLEGMDDDDGLIASPTSASASYGAI